ncbi:MAG: aryl-sulfate sulfotransferase [SAR324 cluster bacterium]|nr:aryl-sulfate sulfotransferase [SAR324 cluster bacterium]
MAYPSVYPTGTTIYNPEKCWNGYTLFPGKSTGAVLIDMSGRVVQLWKGLDGFPNKLLPGGFVLGTTGQRNDRYGFQDMLDLVQVDWEGNIVWKFNRYERIKDPRQKAQWMARQHHDFQREGNPVGYYVPGMEPYVDQGNTLMICHKNLKHPGITDRLLLDDTFIEVTWQGKVVWEWICSEHFEELGFSEEARNTLYRHPNIRPELGVGDWMHINSMSALGPNKWYDDGDQRFHPENIIWGSRQSNIIAIIDKKTGKIVWKLGPDYTASDELRCLGQIIGQHHPHLIPRGLPGEGNILLFDNGGWAGYGAPNPGSPTGHNNALRDYSRVLEFNPLTLEIVWQYTPLEAGFIPPLVSAKFYSGFISSAQRLPNGNTLITEGADGRLFEITAEHELVWEYISPYFGKYKKMKNKGRALEFNMVYRSYRVPYTWVPQLDFPEETPIFPPNIKRFRVPGSPPFKAGKVTMIKT